jgi:hypothetical protein
MIIKVTFGYYFGTEKIDGVGRENMSPCIFCFKSIEIHKNISNTFNLCSCFCLLYTTHFCLFYICSSYPRTLTKRNLNNCQVKQRAFLNCIFLFIFYFV